MILPPRPEPHCQQGAELGPERVSVWLQSLRRAAARGANVAQRVILSLLLSGSRTLPGIEGRQEQA